MDALGAVLNKPQWWRKWQDPEIRAKWFREIDEELISANVDQVTKAWPHSSPYHCSNTFEEYLDVARYTGDGKQAKIDHIPTHVLYPPLRYEYDAFREG